jgi:Ca2+-binding RTX toxin-like protein
VALDAADGLLTLPGDQFSPKLATLGTGFVLAFEDGIEANLENLRLIGAAAIDGRGNDVANIITGNAAANVLTGGPATDTLNGGLGDDTYVLESGNDIVVVSAVRPTWRRRRSPARCCREGSSRWRS